MKCLSFPWNQKTIVGCLATIIITTKAGAEYLHIVDGLLTFLITIGDYHHAFSENLHTILERMNEITLKHNRENAEIKKMLCEIIGLRIMMIEWVSDFSHWPVNSINKRFFYVQSIFWKTADIFSMIILIQMISSILQTSLSILLMDMVGISNCIFRYSLMSQWFSNII